MEKPAIREITLNRIARSIEESWTLEQLLSTEQFFCLYYSRFGFDNQYLHREWTMDNQIREKKQALTALEGAQSITFDPRRPSLKRLEDYVTTISLKEFQHQWTELQIQLAGIGMVEMSLYPSVCERAATLSHQVVKQTNTTPIVITNSSLAIQQCSIDEHTNQVLEVYQQAHVEAKESIAQNSYIESSTLAVDKASTDSNVLVNDQNNVFSTKDIPSRETNEYLSYSNQINQLSLVADEVSNLILTGDMQESNKETIHPVLAHNYDTNSHINASKNKIDATQHTPPDTVMIEDSSDSQFEPIYIERDAKLGKKVYQGGYLITTDCTGSLLVSNKTLQLEPPTEKSTSAHTSGFTYEYHYKGTLFNQQMAFSKSNTADPYVANTKEDNSTEVGFNKVIHLTPSVAFNQGNVKAKTQKPLTINALKVKVSLGDKTKVKTPDYYSRDTGSNRDVGLSGYVVKHSLKNKIEASDNKLSLLENTGNKLPIVGTSSTNTVPNKYFKYPFYDSESFVSTSTQPVTPLVRLQLVAVNKSNVPFLFDSLENQGQEAVPRKKNHYIPCTVNLVEIDTGSKLDHEYSNKDKQRELVLNRPDYSDQYYGIQLGQLTSIDSKAENYFGAAFYNSILEGSVSHIDVKSDWPLSRHYKLDYKILRQHGLPVDQANLFSQYASVYTDNPQSFLSLN